MKKIKTYEDFVNEEINLRKGLMGAALGAGLALSNPVHSQDVRTTNIIKPVYKTTPYDSTTNYVKATFNNFEKSKSQLSKLIGQTLFLKPKYSSGKLNTDYGYGSISSDVNNKDKFIIDSLVGKYFIVDDVVDKNSYYPFLKIRERDSGNIYYYEYKVTRYTEDEMGFPFIVGGFYVKQTQLLSGSELIVSRYSDNSGNGVKLVKNGKIIRKCGDDVHSMEPYFRNSDAPAGEYGSEYSPDFDKMKLGKKFKFVGLTVDVNQSDSPLCLEFEDTEGYKILIKYDDVFGGRDGGTGISYPSTYYSHITVNFYINVNIYR